jgi:hypothetical protein
VRVEIFLEHDHGTVAGDITVAKCGGDITAEGFDWPEEVTLERRQEVVLTAAVQLELVPVATMPQYRKGTRRIIIVDPAWPED